MVLGKEQAIDIDPRQKCLQDLEEWISAHKQNREKIIMMMDANQTVHAETRSYSLKQAMRNCHLQSAMEEAYPGKTLRSVDRGSHTIDHILTAGINQALIRKVGQLPFGIGFSSDHRAIFADFSTENILRLHVGKLEQQDSRRLSSKNKKTPR